MKPLAQMIFVSYLAFAAVGAAMILQELLKSLHEGKTGGQIGGGN